MAERVTQQALALLIQVGVQGAVAVPHAVARLVQTPVVLTAQAGGRLVARAGQTGVCAVWVSNIETFKKVFHLLLTWLPNRT